MKLRRLSFWAGAAVCSIALVGFGHRGETLPSPASAAEKATGSQPQQSGTQTSAPMPQDSQQPPTAEQNPFARTEKEKSPTKKSAKSAAPPPLYKGPIPDPDPKMIAQAVGELSFRLIGPANPSGRVWQVVGVPPKDGKGITTTFYICTAGGGVWKSTDTGTTIVPIFNDEGASSCGAVSVAPSDEEQVWVGTGEPASVASNSLGRGVFRSVNGGASWVFAGLAETEEISAIVIDPRDTNRVYVAALGHLWGRNAERGIFKTTDGGKSWKKALYVDDSTGFSDLVMDPHNPETLYAAAWQRIRWGGEDLVESGPGSGIYKTTDGGTTWTKLTAGLPDKCTYAAMKPLNDEEEESAAAAKRQAGDKSGVEASKREDEEKKENEEEHKRHSNDRVDRQSIEVAEQYFLAGQRRAEDAGQVASGASCMGKITLAIAQSNSNIVYAAILTGQERPMPEWVSDPNATERTSKDGGVFRSDDAGAHWKRVGNSETSYSLDRIVVDSTDDQRVWMPVTGLLRSRDSGETFAGENVAHVHSGFHALWIDPLAPDHMVLGGDGGVYTTFNGARSWMQQVLPVGQVYKVAVDNQEPYWVYAGMEGAAHWAAPSRTYDAEGITNYDWFKLRYRGDGMSVAPDPHDPNIVYMVEGFGNTSRLDQRTWTRQELQPPPSMATKLGLHPLRWDLTPPLLILSNASAKSHEDGEGGSSGGTNAGADTTAGQEHGAGRGGSTTLLLGANYIFRCTVPLEMPYYPDSWGEKYCRVISPDLTAQQDRKIEGVRDGYHGYGALSALAQSHISPQVIWAGADDGPIWVTRDNGAHWQRAADVVTGSGAQDDTAARMPADGVVAHLESSKSGSGAAYAVIDQHTRDDRRPYIYFTKDYGATWRNITGDLPKTGQAYVVLEDPSNAEVLYAGTEFGLYVTLDGGTHWVRWNTDLPTAPIRTMAIQARDREIVVGTFGRGIYVGDIGPFAQMAEAFANKAFLFNSTTAVAAHTRYTFGAATQQLNGDMFLRGQNPSYGMPLYYYLSEPVRAGVRLIVTDEKGQLVRSLLAPSMPGFHVFYWDLDWQLQILMNRLKYRSVEERVEHPEILDDELAFTFSERLARRLVPPGSYVVTLYPNDSPSPDEVPGALTAPRKVRVKNESTAITTGPVRK